MVHSEGFIENQIHTLACISAILLGLPEDACIGSVADKPVTLVPAVILYQLQFMYNLLLTI